VSGDHVESMCLTTAVASIPPFSVGMRLCFLRSRPDVVKEWDNSEVARRWLGGGSAVADAVPCAAG